MRKGFTLIELLIVIAIIGILAAALLVSLGGAREAARDARRIGDLRQVQTTLELYFNVCGHYPGGSSCADVSNPSTWGALGTSINGVVSSVSQIPQDPLGGSLTYDYDVNGIRQTYLLQAVLENDNQALQNSFTGSLPGGVNGGVIDCDILVFKYCVSL